MDQRIEYLRDYFINQKKHHAFRQERRPGDILAEQFSKENTPALDRAVRRVRYIIDREIPVVFPEERIALMRTVPETPLLFTEEEYKNLRQNYWIHESGDFNNFCPDYAYILKTGFNGLKDRIHAQKLHYRDSEEKIRFLDAMLEMILSLEDLAGRYRECALQTGNQVVAQTFSRIPAQPAESLLEAMQFVRLLNYGLWCANNYQCALGRIDQTLYPYYLRDLEEKQYTRQDVLSLVEEFFLGFNRDSDLYDGVQQGDNGQSLVLGGMEADGTDSYQELSAIMMQASLELHLIDPKINLRVTRNTSLERLVEATRLTREGLGFPQYLNDDVIIPALKNWGYSEKDAHNYVAAACWEPIIPGNGTDIVNADGMNFPLAVLRAVHQQLPHCRTYPEFETAVYDQIARQGEEICQKLQNLYVFPAPMASFMMTDCIETAVDIARGSTYQNIGIHGVGISTATDSMAAIRKYVFEEKTLSPELLAEMLKTDFRDQGTWKNRLRYQAPKMGNDDDGTDAIATGLFDAFADFFREKRTATEGVFRPGTASAMYYIWYGQELGATPDGRGAGDPLPANDSPSLFARNLGPVSVVKSFTKQHLPAVANGGPLTLELHNSIFNAPDSLEKTAQLVRLFLHRGGHQLQINSVNREDMLEAQKHPEKYRNLIVRVWGWSGYFVELDPEFQNQIIQRTEFSL